MFLSVSLSSLKTTTLTAFTLCVQLTKIVTFIERIIALVNSSLGGIDMTLLFE